MSNPVLTISDGQLKGKCAKDFQGGSFFCFLGIPYARPPIAELRFKAPVPVEPWTGIRDATHEGPECPHRHLLFGHFTGSEDNCLNLNVFTKKLPEDGNGTLKPVMFWIHGGAYMHGSNKSESFGPDYLMSEDIVLLTINYRLGALGFLSLEDQSLEVPGNAGMKDMVLALKWVQKNIKSFGGDPNNVTIFGESAGSASVHYLCLSPLAKGLFHKAIAQSGCSMNIWAKGQSNAKMLAKYLGIEETEEVKILDQLLKISPEKLVKAQHKIPDTFTGDNIRPFAPVVEKKSSEAFLYEQPLDILKNGNFHYVPLMIGYTTQEGLLYEIAKKVAPGVSKKIHNYEVEIPYDLCVEKGSEKSKDIAAKIEKFYINGNKHDEGILKLKSDNQFRYAIQRCVQLQKQHTTAPIYLYRMSVDTPINFYKTFCTSKALYPLFFFYYLVYKSGDGFKKSFLMKLARSLPRSNIPGVCHADDLGYLFKGFLNEDLPKGSIEEISVRRFVKLWTNFAKTGNPTPEKDDLLNNVEWTPVTQEDNHFLDIGTELNVGTNPDVENFEFWDSIYKNC